MAVRLVNPFSRVVGVGWGAELSFLHVEILMMPPWYPDTPTTDFWDSRTYARFKQPPNVGAFPDLFFYPEFGHYAVNSVSDRFALRQAGNMTEAYFMPDADYPATVYKYSYVIDLHGHFTQTARADIGIDFYLYHEDAPFGGGFAPIFYRVTFYAGPALTNSWIVGTSNLSADMADIVATLQAGNHTAVRAVLNNVSVQYNGGPWFQRVTCVSPDWKNASQYVFSVEEQFDQSTMNGGGYPNLG